MSRKPIGKKTRFEVFKRDGFACQYCGAHPPSAVLEVDHIVSVAEGGDNDQDNLVTACFDCNRGKGSTSLVTVPQSLADKAAEVAEREEQLRGYNEILQARRDRVEADIWRVVKHWTGKTETTKEIYAAIKRFVERLGVHRVLDAVDIALEANFSSSRREFRYFCGICWNWITADDAAKEANR